MDIQKVLPFAPFIGLEKGQIYFDEDHGPSFLHIGPGTPGYDDPRCPCVRVGGRPFKAFPRTQAVRDYERAYFADARWVTSLIGESAVISASQLTAMKRSEELYRQLLVFPFVKKALESRDDAREPTPLDLPLDAAPAAPASPFLEMAPKSFLRHFWASTETAVLVQDGRAYEASSRTESPTDIELRSAGVRVSLLVAAFYEELTRHVTSHVLPGWEARMRERLERSEERFDAALQWARLSRSVVAAPFRRELWAGKRYASPFSLFWWPPHGLMATLRVKPVAMTGADRVVYYYGGGRIGMPLLALYAAPSARIVYHLEGPAHPFVSAAGGQMCLAGKYPPPVECTVQSVLEHLVFAATTMARGMHSKTGSTLQYVTCLEAITAAEARRRGVAVQPFDR